MNSSNFNLILYKDTVVSDMHGPDYCRDAKKMEELASQLSDSSELAPSTDGNEVQKLLGAISDRAKEDKFLYTKFFAIGLFRLLELTGGQSHLSFHL